MTEVIEKQLYRARISFNDFEEAISFLAALKSTRKDITRKALLTAAVISYARPFLDNERRQDSAAAPRLQVKLSSLRRSRIPNGRVIP
jgi:hypothetical protein